MHFYAYLCIFCAYLCIFMHILCICMHVFISFMHIYTYCCTCNSFLCIFMHIYVFSNIFMDVYVYWHIFVHICVLYACVYIFTHIYSWEDADLLSMKNHAAGLHSTGNWISASTLNINLSASFTGSIDIHSNAEPEWPHGTVAGSALCAYRYIWT